MARALRAFPQPRAPGELAFFFSAILAAAVFLIVAAHTVAALGEEVSFARTVASRSVFAAASRATTIRAMPKLVKGIYLSSWTAGDKGRRSALADLVQETELNSVVIDIKDSTGIVAYASVIPLAQNSYGGSPRIPDLQEFVAYLHGQDIWVIARQAVFQDPFLAEARLDLAVISKRNGRAWRDHKGLRWVDAAAREAWEYNLDIAEEALRLGFDEIQFDYVRFPSDGNIDDMAFPHLGEEMQKYDVIRDFFAYARERLGTRPFSLDLFGMTFLRVDKPEDDLGIGQRLVDAIPYADAVSPMVYPSHYPPHFEGFANPAAFPGEVVQISLQEGKKAFMEETRATVRPWLQDFDLGAVYTPKMVRAQIDVAEAEGSSGWLLWNPRNVYTKEALRPNSR